MSYAMLVIPTVSQKLAPLRNGVTQALEQPGLRSQLWILVCDMAYIEFSQKSCLLSTCSLCIPISCGGLFDQHGDFEEAGNDITNTQVKL